MIFKRFETFVDRVERERFGALQVLGREVAFENARIRGGVAVGLHVLVGGRGRSIEEDERGDAVVFDPVAREKEVRQSNLRFGVAAHGRAPVPLGGFKRVLRLPVSVEVLTRLRF